MAYNRIFPIAAGSYNPGDNPVLTGKCVVDAAAYAADEPHGISTTNYASASTGWHFVIYGGDDISAIGNYDISAKNSPDGFTLTSLAGGAVTIPDGTYTYRLFNPAVPNSNDRPCEGILISGVGSADMEVITTSGQYFSIPTSYWSPTAIYNLGISEIIATGGTTGTLLGTYGMPGTAYIP
jgi:hypothetical protein